MIIKKTLLVNIMFFLYFINILSFQVDCGSIDKILENLMGFNLSFLTVFLDTFVLFMKPQELYDFLIDQYNKNLVINKNRNSITGFFEF